jgi:hypothetical protein
MLGNKEWRGSFEVNLPREWRRLLLHPMAAKVLIPVNRYDIEVSGVVDEPLPLQVAHW